MPAAVPPESVGNMAVSLEDMLKEERDLLARISLKENKLRNLELLHSYRNRNDYNSVEVNIVTWRKALRAALMAIEAEHPAPKPPISYFITSLGIDPEIVGFDERNGCFFEEGNNQKSAP
ncbi:hypothetical protein BV898_08421 [Hypsibius exemplaris]|uniref:Meiosis protein 5 homolog n=1 Tax=Hypsibius exemplaris TaxID=2072580 RepID=A0A1W0WQK5_HYPEX|nr:hypothetical protein BV898_08421 [Hypsibius exemplaris]